jgi:hypothetical protein
MVRSVWIEAVGALLVGTGLVWGQQPTSPPRTPPGGPEEIVTIQEAGKPEQKCKVLRSWTTPEGHRAHEVQVLGTGEMVTLVEGTPVAPRSGADQALSTRLYHWGRDGTRPPGTPLPPIQRTQYTVPAPAATPAPTAVRNVPVPTPAPSTGGMPVVVTEVQEERPPLGSRVKDAASRLFHRDRTETMPIIMESAPTPAAPAATPAAAPAPTGVQRVTAPPAATAPTPAADARVAPVPAASRAWPAAFAGQPASPSTGTRSIDNPIMSMSPPAPGMPQQVTRMVPTQAPATPAPPTTPAAPMSRLVQTQATAPAPAPATPPAMTRIVPAQAPAAPPTTSRLVAAPPNPCCECQPSSGPVVVQAAPAKGQTVTVTPCPSCSCDCSSGPVIVQGTVPADMTGPKTTSTGLGLRGRLSSLFGSGKTTSGETVTVISTTECPSPCAAPTTSVAPTKVVAEAPKVEAPRSSDWRQSWGKLDSFKTQVAEAPRTDTPKTDVTSTRKPDVPKSDVVSSVPRPVTPFGDTSKHEVVTVSSKPPVPVGLPVADTRQPDPLKDPMTYVRRPGSDAFPPKMSEDHTAFAERTGPSGHAPLGTQSVMDAGAPQFVPVPIVTVPDYRRPPMPPPAHVPQPPEPNHADIANAFTNPAAAPPQEAVPVVANAFTPAPAPVDPTVMAHGAFGPTGQAAPPAGMMPPPGYGPRMPAQYPPPGYYPMAREMAPPAPSAPVAPTSYAPVPTPPVQGVHQTSYQVATANPAPPSAPALSSRPATGAPSEAMATLRDSIYPSQREWAAAALASCNWREQPEVLHAVLTAAREDPAASVRAACVRALAKMKAHTAPVLTALQGLKTDGDPRVLHEVEAALATLSAEKMTR